MRLSTVKGVLIGASLAYLLDPLLGPMRRALLSERVVSLSRVGHASLQARMRLGGPGQWEEPMVTIHIDVDNQDALPGSGHHATTGAGTRMKHDVSLRSLREPLPTHPARGVTED